MPKRKVLTFQEALSKCSSAKKVHVLLGNGFSRAWKDDVFSYHALLDQADFKTMSTSARGVFGLLGTSDFEAVIRALQTTAQVLQHYQPKDTSLGEVLRSDATKLKRALVKAIAGNHPDRPDAVTMSEYQHARTFLSHFDSIYTLNYDLLLYWASMQNEIEPTLSLDDGFRTPDSGQSDYVTWEVDKTDRQNVFYLHGALHFFDAGFETQKYTWVNTGVPLMDQIRAALDRQLYPIFVAEGESSQKLAKIKHNDLLSRALRSFAKIAGALFIFGHSMSPNDEHITRLVSRNRVSHLCVGVFGDINATANKRIVSRCLKLTKERPEKYPLELSFFDSSSAHVWR